MTTTVMKNSRVGDTWIQEMCKLNPVQRVLDEKTGLPNGSILTGPVRLAFTDAVMEAKPAMRSDPTSKLKHSVTLMFPPYTDFGIFWEEYYKIAAQEFAAYYNAAASQYYGIDNPFFDGGTKANKYEGFTPGCLCLNTASKFRPPVVDPRNNPVIDPNKLYPGVWAIAALNSYASGKTQPKKGPRFGLQTLMLVGDDTNIGGGAAPDPRTQFKGVNVKPPTVAPGQAFAQGVPPGAVPGGYAPGAPSVGAYYPPGGHASPMMPGIAPGGYVPPMPLSRPPLGDGNEDMSQFV